MTLRELIAFLRLYVSYPCKFGDIKLRNQDDFCRYPLIKYFLSDDFQYDMYIAEDEFAKYSYPGINFSFLFHRKETGEFWLTLEHEIVDVD